jgi:hypothetical protein
MHYIICVCSEDTHVLGLCVRYSTVIFDNWISGYGEPNAEI